MTKLIFTSILLSLCVPIFAQQGPEEEVESVEEPPPVPFSRIFLPDPTKRYYIDAPKWNKRIGATGESEDAYTTSTGTTGSDVEWQFVAKGNGAWHIQRIAGGILSRLRTDNSANADMHDTASNGSFTYFDLTPSNAIDNTYHLTLRDGPAKYKRLQIDSSGAVRFVTAAADSSWESFRITESKEEIDEEASVVGANYPTVHIRKRNATGYALDGGRGGADGQNLYLWKQNDANVNQQWIEINRGKGYYSYQKKGTNYCIDGGDGGAIAQNVRLWTCSDDNDNQQWLKEELGGRAFRLSKRNALGFAIDGGNRGRNGQQIKMYTSTDPSHNLQWFITPTVANYTANCRDVQITTSKGQIEISGLDKAVISTVQVIQKEDNKTVFSCGGTCKATEKISVSEGDYLIKVSFFTDTWQQVCTASAEVSISSLTDHIANRMGKPSKEQLATTSLGKTGTANTITVDGITKIEATTSRLNPVQVYPNPAKTVLFVSSIGKGEKGAFVLFNQFGQKLKQIDLSTLHKETIQLDISAYEPGLYLMSTRLKGGGIFSEKLFIQ